MLFECAHLGTSEVIIPAYSGPGQFYGMPGLTVSRDALHIFPTDRQSDTSKSGELHQEMLGIVLNNPIPPISNIPLYGSNYVDIPY